MILQDASVSEINGALELAWNAFHNYRNRSLKQRADFMRAIAKELDALGDTLIETAAADTHLPAPRLQNEKTRTVYQLNSYAAACERGDWVDARIDTGLDNEIRPNLI